MINILLEEPDPYPLPTSVTNRCQESS